MAETFSVQAILSAVDKGFRSTMKDAKQQAGGLADENKKANTSMLDIAKGVGVFKLLEAGVSAVTNSVGGAISRFDTLNKYPTVMEALGYSTDEVTASMDKLDKGIDGLPTSMDEIVASTQQIAIATGDLEKGTDTAIALNNAFLASGASSADASRGAEQYIQMLSKGEVDLQSWRTLQETMPIAMDKVAKSFEDRGVTSVNELYDALKEGDITFDEFNDRMLELNEGVGGFADLAEKNSKGIATSFKNIRTAVVKGVEKTIRAVDEALQDAGFGSIADILDNVKGLVNDFFGFIISITPTVIDTIMEIVNVLKKLSPVLVPLIAVIATYQGITGSITRAVKLWVGAQKLLKAVMATNPFILFISVLVVLVGWLIYMWKTNENFRNAVIEIWGNIKDFISGIPDAIKNAWKGLKDWFNNLWDGIANGFKDAWNGIVTSTKESFDTIVGFIKDKLAIAYDFFEPLISIITDVFGTIVEHGKVLFENLGDIFRAGWELIKNITLAPLLFITSMISGGWEEAKNNMIAVWENIKENAAILWEAMKNIVKSATEATIEIFKTLWEGAIEIIKSVGGAILGFITETWNKMTEKTKETWNNIVEATKNKWSDMKTDTLNKAKDIANGARESWENMRKSTREKMDQVKSILKSLSEIDLRQIGKDVINGFVEGIKSMFKAVKDTITNLASMVTDGLKDLLKIKSPSRVMMGISKWIPAGVAKGIEDNTKQVDKAMANMVDTDLVNPIADDLNNAFNSVGKTSLSNEMNINHNNQPAYINLSLGGQNFKAFVENIGSTMGQEADLLAQY